MSKETENKTQDLKEERVYSIISGQFLDEELEHEYGEFFSKNSVPTLNNVLLVLAVVFFILTFKSMSNTISMLVSVTLRTVVIMAAVANIFFVAKEKYVDVGRYRSIVFLFQALMVVTFLYVTGSTRNPVDSSFVKIEMIILITCFFIMKGNWLGTITISLLFMSFFAILPYVIPGYLEHFQSMDKQKYLTSNFYVFLVVLLNALALRETSTAERKSFLADKKVKAMLSVDPLTGFLTRNHFLQDVTNHHKRVIKHNDIDSVMLLFSIENFELINIKHGYAAGDQLIKDISKTVKNYIINKEIPAQLGRLDGTQFCILFKNTDFNTITDFIQDMMSILSELPMLKEHTDVFVCKTVVNIKDYDNATNALKQANENLIASIKEYRVEHNMKVDDTSKSSEDSDDLDDFDDLDEEFKTMD